MDSSTNEKLSSLPLLRPFLWLYGRINLQINIMAENEARRRVPATKTEIGGATQSTEPSGKRSGINVVDILRGITGLLLLTAALSWFITGESIVWNWRQLPTLLGTAKRAVVCISNKSSISTWHVY